MCIAPWTANTYFGSSCLRDGKQLCTALHCRWQLLAAPSRTSHWLTITAPGRRVKLFTYTLCKLAQSKRTWASQKDLPRSSKYCHQTWARGKLRPALCASLRSRNAHGHFTKSFFMREFTGKMAHPKINPAVQTLHEHGHRNTGTFRKNTGGQSTYPDQSPAFYLPEEPPVWTHCLGEKGQIYQIDAILGV